MVAEEWFNYHLSLSFKMSGCSDEITATISMIPSNYPEVNFEKWREDTQAVIGGYSKFFNLLDPNNVPGPAIHDPHLILQMNNGQRAANEIALTRMEDYTSAMKRATTGVALSARNNQREKTVLLEQRRQLNLADGVNPPVTVMLQRLQNAFNPVSTVNASALLKKIQGYKL